MAFDVLVAGGGPAGFAAAVAAARAGAKTTLIERNGFCGGTATASWVAGFNSFCNESRQVVGGIGWEMVERARTAGVAEDRGFVRMTANPAIAVHRVEFDPEPLKAILDDLLVEAGVHLLYHAAVSGAQVEAGRLRRVQVASKGRAEWYEARVFVDATGDGDVAALAGVPMRKRPLDELQPMTLCFRLGGVDVAALAGMDPFHLSDLVRRAHDEGRLPARYLALHRMPNGRDVIVNATRVSGYDGTDPAHLAEAEREGRRQVDRVVSFLRRELPPFRSAYVNGIAPRIGVRETRRIVGEYILGVEDVREGRCFPDQVALATNPMDYHQPGGGGVQFQEVPEVYGIPYRTLIPRGIEGLLVAGRCFSADEGASSSARMMPTCMAMGQAAGVAAALAAAEGGAVRGVSVRSLQDQLRAQGAILE